MKKLFLVLVAMFGLYLGVGAQITYSCNVYNEDGLNVELLERGTQADRNGGIYVSVKATAPAGTKHSRLSSSVKVYVEIIDQDTRKVVNRKPIDIDLTNGKGSQQEYFRGYEPFHDYLFSIDKDKTCVVD